MGTRINPHDLYIKNSYRTSDDVIHIVLSGKISNGIPEGLLWNEDSADFGAPSGNYLGRGDFKIGALGPETGGSVAIGSPDFSAEWVMAGPYTAVVLEGLVEANISRTTIIEKNESLNLLSSGYRNKFYPEAALYTSPGGKLQKESTYSYDPNNFSPWPEPDIGGELYWTNPGDKRGGYVMLISKSEKAVPYIASFDIEYSNGTKKRFEVDYSDVQLREEIPLTKVRFQSPTPDSDYDLTEDFQPDPLNSEIYIIYYVVQVEADDITKQGDTVLKPLLLRPLYDPVDIDPRKTTTNMINNVYLTDEVGMPLNNDNLVLDWDDETQAISLYIKEGAPPELIPAGVTINAFLRLPYRDAYTNVGETVTVSKLECVVTINPPTLPPS
jgi:hypothetical protein